MSNDISNMDQYHLDHYTEELEKAEKHHSAGLSLMKFAMVVTLILYGLFTVHLYLGNGLSWGEYFKTANGTIWFFTMLAVAALLSIFLAWVKHFAYTHFSKFAPVVSVTFTVIAFALFAEFFSSSANQDAKSQAILNTDSAYQATVKQQSPTITTNSHLASDIAKAEQRLARCYENLKRGKEKHCRGDKAKVQSLKQSQQASGDMQVQASVAMQSMNYARQDKLKADSHNPTIVTVAKLLSGVMGGNYADYIKVATLLVMILVAAAFEKLHHFLSRALRESDSSVQHNKRKIAELYDQHNGGMSKIDVDDKQEKNNFGFVPATAQKENAPRFKYQNQDAVAKKQPIGFVNTDSGYLSPNDNYQSPTPEDRNYSNKEDILDVSIHWDNDGANGWCDRVMVYGTGRRSTNRFLDLNRAGKEFKDELSCLKYALETVDLYIRNNPKFSATFTGCKFAKKRYQLLLNNRDKNTSPLSTIERQNDLDLGGSETLPNPAQTLSESEINNPAQTLPNPASRVQGQAGSKTGRVKSDTKERDLEAEKKGADLLYPEWKRAVLNGYCKTSITGSRKWIRQRIKETDSVVHKTSREYVSSIVDHLFVLAVQAGFMHLNPKYTGAKSGVTKYLLTRL